MLQRQGLIFWNSDEVRNQWLHLRHYAREGRLLSISRQRAKISIDMASARIRFNKGLVGI
jgi:hypothetical protein